MPTFGRRSKKELATAHPDLQRLFNEVIKEFDCAVICGHRGRADQEKAFAEGKSKVQWPNSKHNATPARAVDVMPFPVNWDDIEGIKSFAVIVKSTAARLNIRVRWGGDFRGNWDKPHWEMIP